MINHDFPRYFTSDNFDTIEGFIRPNDSQETVVIEPFSPDSSESTNTQFDALVKQSMLNNLSPFPAGPAKGSCIFLGDKVMSDMIIEVPQFQLKYHVHSQIVSSINKFFRGVTHMPGTPYPTPNQPLVSVITEDPSFCAAAIDLMVRASYSHTNPIYIPIGPAAWFVSLLKVEEYFGCAPLREKVLQTLKPGTFSSPKDIFLISMALIESGACDLGQKHFEFLYKTDSPLDEMLPLFAEKVLEGDIEKFVKDYFLLCRDVYNTCKGQGCFPDSRCHSRFKSLSTSLNLHSVSHQSLLYKKDSRFNQFKVLSETCQNKVREIESKREVETKRDIETKRAKQKLSSGGSSDRMLQTLSSKLSKITNSKETALPPDIQEQLFVLKDVVDKALYLGCEKHLDFPANKSRKIVNNQSQIQPLD